MHAYSLLCHNMLYPPFPCPSDLKMYRPYSNNDNAASRRLPAPPQLIGVSGGGVVLVCKVSPLFPRPALVDTSSEPGRPPSAPFPLPDPAHSLSLVPTICAAATGEWMQGHPSDPPYMGPHSIAASVSSAAPNKSPSLNQDPNDVLFWRSKCVLFLRIGPEGGEGGGGSDTAWAERAHWRPSARGEINCVH